MEKISFTLEEFNNLEKARQEQLIHECLAVLADQGQVIIDGQVIKSQYEFFDWQLIHAYRF